MPTRRLPDRTGTETAALPTVAARRSAAPMVTEPDTVTVHVPIAFRRRGGRRTVTAPDGSPVAFPSDRPQVDSALVKALARAFRWRNLVEADAHSTIHDLAATERMNPSYISRILRLTLLAPDIVEAALDGRHGPSLTLGTTMRPFPIEWDDQRRLLGNE